MLIATTSPSLASAIFSASSTAYFVELVEQHVDRFPIQGLVVVVELFSAQVSGTCFTQTAIFMGSRASRSMSARRLRVAAKVAADCRKSPPLPLCYRRVSKAPNRGLALGAGSSGRYRLPVADLILTGERTIPGLAIENYWFRRHEAAYAWIIRQFPLSDRSVVDAGSGEGYGAAMLQRAGASRVTALEYDEVAAAHSAAQYPAISTLCCNLDAMPLPDTSADLIVSMQVIEHLWNLPRFLAECHRILRPGGQLVTATPNRLTFSPGLRRGEKPANPFHVEEFDSEQLAQLLQSAGFEHVIVYGVRHAPRISPTIVARQLQAVLADDWPEDLVDEVADVRIDDFAVTAAEAASSLDLIGVGRRPVAP